MDHTADRGDCIARGQLAVIGEQLDVVDVAAPGLLGQQALHAIGAPPRLAGGCHQRAGGDEGVAHADAVNTRLEQARRRIIGGARLGQCLVEDVTFSDLGRPLVVDLLKAGGLGCGGRPVSLIERLIVFGAVDAADGKGHVRVRRRAVGVEIRGADGAGHDLVGRDRLVGLVERPVRPLADTPCLTVVVRGVEVAALQGPVGVEDAFHGLAGRRVGDHPTEPVAHVFEHVDAIQLGVLGQHTVGRVVVGDVLQVVERAVGRENAFHEPGRGGRGDQAPGLVDHGDVPAGDGHVGHCSSLSRSFASGRDASTSVSPSRVSVVCG